MRLIDADKLQEHSYETLLIIGHNGYTDDCVKEAPTVDAIPISIIEDIKAEIKSICENTIYPPDDTFFREVVDEDYFFGLEYAIKIIDKHTSGKE